MGEDFTFGSMFGAPTPERPLDGLHVSRAGDFYWPSGGLTVNKYPPSAPALSAGQVRSRIRTGEVRKVRG